MTISQSLPPLKIGHLTLRLPILQGGMGVAISLANLASAIANEGGLGTIASAGICHLESDRSSNYREASNRGLRRQIRAARAQTKGAIGVNIMVALTNFDDMARVSVEEGVDAIISGAGLPLNLPACRPAGSPLKLIPIVSSGRAASILARRWLDRFDCLPDAFVVEGPLAGGHLGFRPEHLEDPGHSLERLLGQVLDVADRMEKSTSVRIPVIAAGGVYTGADIRRFLDMGAAGVQMATRFVTTRECDAAEAFKRTYLDAQPEDLVIIQSPVGLPGRAIRNAFTEAMKNGRKAAYTCPFHCIATCDEKNSPYCIAQALLNACRGNFRAGFAFAGANAWRATEILSVAETVRRIRQEYSESAGSRDGTRG